MKSRPRRDKYRVVVCARMCAHVNLYHYLLIYNEMKDACARLELEQQGSLHGCAGLLPRIIVVLMLRGKRAEQILHHTEAGHGGYA